MGADYKIFSYDEISLHNNSQNCWVIIDAKAYDVTNFLGEHPGGEHVLLVVAGKDASVEFENAGHGSSARLMLDEYYVGEVDPSTNPPIPDATIAYLTPNQEETPKDGKGASSSSLFLKLLQSLLIMGLAAVIHFYTKSSSKAAL